MTAKRRGHASSYAPTHDHLQPLSTHALRSCGLCLRHRRNVGGSKSRVLGWICNDCTEKRGTR